MDVTPSTVVVSGSGEEGLSTTTIGAMLLFFLAIAGFGYYVIQKSKAPALTPKVPVNPAFCIALPERDQLASLLHFHAISETCTAMAGIGGGHRYG